MSGVVDSVGYGRNLTTWRVTPILLALHPVQNGHSCQYNCLVGVPTFGVVRCLSMFQNLLGLSTIWPSILSFKTYFEEDITLLVASIFFYRV